jgi:hypothetical protein
MGALRPFHLEQLRQALAILSSAVAGKTPMRVATPAAVTVAPAAAGPVAAPAPVSAIPMAAHGQVAAFFQALPWDKALTAAPAQSLGMRVPLPLAAAAPPPAVPIASRTQAPGSTASAFFAAIPWHADHAEAPAAEPVDSFAKTERLQVMPPAIAAPTLGIQDFASEDSELSNDTDFFAVDDWEKTLPAEDIEHLILAEATEQAAPAAQGPAQAQGFFSALPWNWPQEASQPKLIGAARTALEMASPVMATTAEATSLAAGPASASFFEALPWNWPHEASRPRLPTAAIAEVASVSPAATTSPEGAPMTEPASASFFGSVPWGKALDRAPATRLGPRLVPPVSAIVIPIRKSVRVRGPKVRATNYFPHIPWSQALAEPLSFAPDEGIEDIGAQAGVALDEIGDAAGLSGNIMLAATQSALRAAERAAAENESAALPAPEQAPPSEGYISRLIGWIFPKH